MKKQKSDRKVQPVLVYTDFTDTGNKAMQWAVFVCSEMNRRLIVLHVADHNTRIMASGDDPIAWARKKLSDIKAHTELHYNVRTSTHVEEGCNCTVISRCSEDEDVIFAICGVHAKNDPQYLSGKTVVKMARRSRIPFLFVQKNTPDPTGLQKIAFPVSIQRQVKEKVSWGIFLSKHLRREVVMLTPKEKDEIRNNLLFTQKFFQQLEIQFSEQPLDTGFLNIEPKAMHYAFKNSFLLSVLLLAKGKSFTELLLGPQELRFICNKYHHAVFMLNPRKDLYIPCI
ncbi:MAG TPA: universal stress protein [Bacteroidales bacterium]|nr:universal stress protein [Bacteroidales bacterium]